MVDGDWDAVTGRVRRKRLDRSRVAVRRVTSNSDGWECSKLCGMNINTALARRHYRQWSPSLQNSNWRKSSLTREQNPGYPRSVATRMSGNGAEEAGIRPPGCGNVGEYACVPVKQLATQPLKNRNGPAAAGVEKPGCDRPGGEARLVREMFEG